MRFRTATAVSCLALAALACTPVPSATHEPHAPAALAQRNTAASPELVAHFDAALGQLPEGLVVADAAAFVGFAPTSQVMRVDLTTFQTSPWGKLPTPVSGKGFMTGLAQA